MVVKGDSNDILSKKERKQNGILKEDSSCVRTTNVETTRPLQEMQLTNGIKLHLYRGYLISGEKSFFLAIPITIQKEIVKTDKFI